MINAQLSGPLNHFGARIMTRVRPSNLGGLLNRSSFLGFLGYLFEQCHTETGQCNFASPKYNRHFNLVFSVDELFYMANFGLQIMFAGFRAYLNFLYLK